MIKIYSLLGALLILTSGCDNAINNDDAVDTSEKVDAYNCPYAPSAPATSEPTYCSSVETFGDAVTITGGARYQRRDVSVGVGLGAVSGTLHPIRHAELAVVDASGTVIQCGETDASGNFSISVPRGSANLSIQVRSRANNNQYKASILNSHGSMQYYSVSASFTPDTGKAIGNIVADAVGTSSGNTLSGLESGAFNILDKILDANNYLRAQVGSCGTNHPTLGCSNFTVAPLVHVFWKPGCNPMNYFNQGAGGVSFYLSGTNRLYILGGINANVNTADTDHFDPVILLHEYGHFLEGQYSSSDSPGGSHDGNTIIDPRLAWSEGWASFFASAVRDVGEYVDTYGNTSGSTGFYFRYNAETNSTGVGTLDPKEGGYTVQTGEGIYREMAILRGLWDSLDTDAADTDNDGVEGSFEELWAVFSGTNGIKNTNYAFINAGLFFELHDAITDIAETNYSSIYTAENFSIDATWGNAYSDRYGVQVSTAQCPTNNADKTILPRNPNNFNENGTLANSNLHASNDFYRLKVTSTTTAALTLDIISGTGDLDLYVYRESHTFGAASTMIGYSNSSVTGPTGDETVNLTNLAPGEYLINVNSYATNPSFNSNTYRLTLGGSQLCPH